MYHFKMIFPMENGSEKSKLDVIMPNGWMLQESGTDDQYNIINALDAMEVGHLWAQPGKAYISVDEQSAAGKKFWQNFGMKYPELNPFDLRFGVLYLSGGEGCLYELDELPKHMSMVPPKDALAHYAKVRAYYVEFFLGNWHPGDSEIKVEKCQRILRGGEVVTERRNMIFCLGHTENESTM